MSGRITAKVIALSSLSRPKPPPHPHLHPYPKPLSEYVAVGIYSPSKSNEHFTLTWRLTATPYKPNDNCQNTNSPRPLNSAALNIILEGRFTVALTHCQSRRCMQSGAYNTPPRPKYLQFQLIPSTCLCDLLGIWCSHLTFLDLPQRLNYPVAGLTLVEYSFACTPPRRRKTKSSVSFKRDIVRPTYTFLNDPRKSTIP